MLEIGIGETVKDPLVLRCMHNATEFGGIWRQAGREFRIHLIILQLQVCLQLYHKLASHHAAFPN